MPVLRYRQQRLRLLSGMRNKRFAAEGLNVISITPPPHLADSSAAQTRVTRPVQLVQPAKSRDFLSQWVRRLELPGWNPHPCHHFPDQEASAGDH